MTLSLMNMLSEQLLPQLPSRLASMTALSVAQAEAATRSVIRMTIDGILAAYHERGVVAAEQLFHASALQNITRDQPIDEAMVLLARDTGRPLLDHLYVEDEQQQARQHTLMTRHHMTAQQAQDVLQTVVTLSLRSIAIELHDQQIQGDGLAALLDQQAKLPPPSEVGQTQHVTMTPESPLLPIPMDSPENSPSAQTRHQQQQSSRWSQYALHGAFLLLILIPVLVFWRACSTVEKTAIQRNQQPPHAIDSGVNGEGSVVPKSGGHTLGDPPTSPAAHDIVPNNGTAPTTPLPVGTAPPPAE